MKVRVIDPTRRPRRPLRSKAATNRWRRAYGSAPAVPRLDVGLICARQRAAVAWELRNILARADRRCARYAQFPVLMEINRADSLRGDVLGLVALLETGASRAA